MNWVNFWTCRKFLGRRFCTFDMFWRLAFSIGGICCILSRVAVHIKAVCIRMNSRKVCKSSLQAFSVTCDFFDEPGNLPLIKKSWVLCTSQHCIHCWTIEPSSWTSLKFVQPFPFAAITPCAQIFCQVLKARGLRQRRVLELGAGAGLAGLVAVAR